MAIRANGTTSRTAATANDFQLPTLARFWKYQASISGMAIFMISEGWMSTPTCSQRRAPFLMMPNTATAMSSVTPKV